MSGLTRIPPLALTLLLGILVLALDAVLPGEFEGPAAAGIAVLLAIAGAALIVLAIVTFRRAQTTLDPRDPARASALVTHGVFSVSRNPIYAGFALWLLALAALLGNPLALAGPVAFVLYMNGVQIPAEERALASHFGDAFARYRQRVRRWI